MTATDLSRLRIHRDERPRRRWLPWVLIGAAALAAVALYPYAGAYLAARRAPEVEIVRAMRVETASGPRSGLPVLVASGYVVARRWRDS
jgi:multidrug efflux pump subunit AcrA (membrane-fusion protein)